MSRRTTLILIVLACLLAACGAERVSLPSTLAPGQLPPMPDGVTPTANGADDARLAAISGLDATPDPADDRFDIGRSVEGRPIWAWRFGEGERRLVLVGAIHGGFEANSALLAELLIDHFRDHPEDVLPGVEIVIIPAANPDGLVRGSGVEARFNANGVDLNRNWGCEWSETAVVQDMTVNPGTGPFSEPESQALRDFFLTEPPAAVVFYHSAAGGVFMGECGDDHPAADWMGEMLEEATGYTYGQFDYYEVSGDASNWLAAQGIPAAIIELNTQTEPEFAQNLRGVYALQCYLTSAGADHPAVQRVCS